MTSTCRIQHRFPVVAAALRGTLDHSAAVDAVVTLRECLADQPVGVVLDVADLTVASPSALRPLVGLARDARRWPGATVVVGGASPDLREQLARLAGEDTVEFAASAEEALTAGQQLPVPPRSEVALPPTADAPAASRELVARLCHEWGVARWERLVQLLASELVMNAVIHARTSLSFMVRHLDGALQVAVRDGDPRLVDRPPPGPYGLPAGDPGRGLLLLETLADDWGCTPTSDGKVTWATVALAPARTSPEHRW